MIMCDNYTSSLTSVVESILATDAAATSGPELIVHDLNTPKTYLKRQNAILLQSKVDAATSPVKLNSHIDQTACNRGPVG